MRLCLCMLAQESQYNISQLWELQDISEIRLIALK